MSITIVHVQLIKITCDCGVVYGLDEDFISSRRKDHKRFYCPNGCYRHYPQYNTEEELTKQLQRERQQHDQTKSELEYMERQKRAVKGHLTKTKNRIKNGICPCCTRTFKNIQRHMKSKHPNYI